MAWRVAKSLLKFRDQINSAAPGRNKSSDGTIGDAKHASRSSDHNPWVKDGATGVVTAIDITHDPANGVNTHAMADFLRQQKDPRIKYVISNRRIWSSTQNPYQWRPYTGTNPHVSHMHISVHSSKAHYDSEKAWEISGITAGPVNPDSPVTRPVLKVGSSGPFVTEIQTAGAAVGYDILIDSVFGPVTEKLVKDFQKKNKLKIDGIVGPLTWAAFDRIEQRGTGEKDGDVMET